MFERVNGELVLYPASYILCSDDTVRDMMKSGKVVGIVLNHIVTGGFGGEK